MCCGPAITHSLVQNRKHLATRTGEIAGRENEGIVPASDLPAAGARLRPHRDGIRVPSARTGRSERYGALGRRGRAGTGCAVMTISLGLSIGRAMTYRAAAPFTTLHEVDDRTLVAQRRAARRQRPTHGRVGAVVHSALRSCEGGHCRGGAPPIPARVAGDNGAATSLALAAVPRSSMPPRRRSRRP